MIAALLVACFNGLAPNKRNIQRRSGGGGGLENLRIQWLQFISKGLGGRGRWNLREIDCWQGGIRLASVADVLAKWLQSFYHRSQRLTAPFINLVLAALPSILYYPCDNSSGGLQALPFSPLMLQHRADTLWCSCPYAWPCFPFCEPIINKWFDTCWRQGYAPGGACVQGWDGRVGLFIAYQTRVPDRKTGR